MNYQLITYRTLTGTKEIIKPSEKRSAQWVVYSDNKPMYHIDCYDLKTESNVILNSLILANQSPVEDVLKHINKKHNLKLSVKRAPLIEIKIKSEIKDLDLRPLPIEWLR